MELTFEATMNPGENALFVVETRIEKSGPVWGFEGWWGLWLTFWLCSQWKWRNWLWGYRNSVEDHGRSLQVRLCGFEFTWQTTEKM